MKIFSEILPIFLFFVTYKVFNIYYATGIAILTSLCQVTYGRIKKGHFEKMPLITLICISILGGATLLFRDEIFIKWKPTAVYWVLSLVFLGSQFIGKRSLLEHLAYKNITLPKEVWKQLNISWALFFAVMGVINLYVVSNFDTDTWVNFKLFGTLGLTLVFVLLQSIFMLKHLKR